MVKYTSMPERTMVRPKRHWRHELLALAPVMALAVAVVVTFRKDVARLRPPISGGDAGKASAANSVTILCSLAELTALMPVLA